MSDRNFNRRRRGGQRFRPSGGLGQPKHTKEASEARAAAIGEKTGEEHVFQAERHEREIIRAENVAAGLPPEGAPATDDAAAHDKKHEFRELRTDVEQATEAEEAGGGGGGAHVEVETPPQPGLIGAIKHVTQKIIQKVTRLIRPKQKSNKDVLINAESLETRVAILEEGRLEDFNIERTNEERLVGSIFKGKIRNLEDGLKAAFVDIGFEKNAFLHYWDIVPSNLDSSVEYIERAPGGRRRERPKITQKDIPRVYPPGSEIVVQVTKGPIGSKGPRVTTHLALPGRYLVLLPNSDQSGISRKIESQEERQRLKKIVRALHIPDGMGVIIRTAGEGQQARYFVRDLAILLEEWKSVQEKIDKQPLATCVFEEPDLIERTVRDFLTEDVDRIIVDDHKQFERIQQLIGRVSKRSVAKVKFYNEPQPLFDRFAVTKQLESAFSRTVMLKGGGYLVFDETEALVAIDVNTGRHKGGKDQDATIYKVNLEAAEEICRQLRLRNIGGLIVLDFIDMRSRKDQQHVYNKVKEGLRRDRAKTHILPISPLGLMEMTRQRHSESVHAAVYDDCPYCHGRGRVKSAETMSVEIQRKLAEILKKRPRDESDFQLRIVVHPSVNDRFHREDEKIIIAMEKKFFGKISFRPDPAMHAEQFKIIDALTNTELAANARRGAD
jgi:ribonuclease G